MKPIERLSKDVSKRIGYHANVNVEFRGGRTYFILVSLMLEDGETLIDFMYIDSASKKQTLYTNLFDTIIKIIEEMI